MNAIVTGGAGFIGSHLVERLVDEGRNVFVIDDLSNGRRENLQTVYDKIKFIKHDISKPLTLQEKADIVFHLACWPRSRSFKNPIRDVEVNIIGIINALEIARKHDSKIIFSSNSGIYDTSTLPISEKAIDNPKTPYDLDKLTAERYLELYGKTYGLEYTIFRFATVYGSRQRTTLEWKPVIAEFLDKLSRNRAPTIYWTGEQTRDFIHVDDIVDALLLSTHIDETNGETMILGTGIETSINRLYEVISRLLKVNITPVKGAKMIGDIPRMRYDCGKALKLMSWQAKTSLKEGIKKCVKETRY